MTDQDLKRAVESELAREVRLRGCAIAVAVEAGTVTLEGEVQRLADARLAINLVRRMREVGEVKDALRLPSLHELSDAQIREHIGNAFMQDPTIHADRLQAEVHQGMVVLTGALDSLEEKRLAGLCAWWVPGVVGVRNEIAVEPAQVGTAGDLLDSIRIAFDKDVLVNGDTIGVAVEGDVVTLTGNVRSDEERLAAEHDVYYIEGVANVINRLVVVVPE